MTAPDPRTKLEQLQARILRRKREPWWRRILRQALSGWNVGVSWWRRVWRWVRGES